MSELSDVVLTRLVQVTIHMPGARWEPTALAEAEGVSEEEVHQVVRALRRAGLVDGAVMPGTLELVAPYATDVGVQHLAERITADGVLPGFTRVSGGLLNALIARPQLTWPEAAQVAGLGGQETQPYLHLLQRLGMINAVPLADGLISYISRRF